MVLLRLSSTVVIMFPEILIIVVPLYSFAEVMSNEKEEWDYSPTPRWQADCDNCRGQPWQWCLTVSWATVGSDYGFDPFQLRRLCNRAFFNVRGDSDDQLLLKGRCDALSSKEIKKLKTE